MNLSYPRLALRLALFTCFFSITSTPAASTDGAEPGKKQFNKCVACHSLEPGVHMMGPSLAGLMGSFACLLPSRQWFKSLGKMSRFKISFWRLAPGTPRS